MSSASTVFVTYQFESSGFTASTSHGYSTPLHCAYVKQLTVDSLTGNTLNLYFNNASEFSFLSDATDGSGTGYTATRFYALVQVTGATGNTIKPDPANWYKVDLTSQIPSHTIGQSINSSNLVSTTYEIPLTGLTNSYDLSYLNYPTNLGNNDAKLAFGEEVFFYGNVKGQIKATAYITDIPISLSLNEFNSTTNPTWDNESAVYITEVGIYDNDGNLVAKGKLNNPIKKDSTIARTLQFSIDF